MAVKALTIERVPWDSLRNHPKNPRAGDTEAIVASIQANEVYRPIITARDGTILAGHHLWFALGELNRAEVDIVRLDVDPASPQATRIMLADNRTADLGRYDDGLLIELLQTLDAQDSPANELWGTGYTDDDLHDLLRQTAARLHPYASIDGASRLTPTPGDALDAYRANATRSLVLTFRLDEWEPLAALLRAARLEHDVDNNAEALLAVLRAAYPEEAASFSALASPA
jgi:hypothetical protein